MVKKEQVPARAVFVQASLWVWSATSRGRPHDGGGASCPPALTGAGPTILAAGRHSSGAPQSWAQSSLSWALPSGTSSSTSPVEGERQRPNLKSEDSGF